MALFGIISVIWWLVFSGIVPVFSHLTLGSSIPFAMLLCYATPIMTTQAQTSHEYQLIRSARKTLALTVTKELIVVVRAPLKMAKRDIASFVAKHHLWLEKQLAAIKEQNANRSSLTEAQAAELKEKAKSSLPEKVAHFSALMGVRPSGFRITAAKTRWGSCSAKNSLNFTYRIMLLPEDLIDYIVVHELAHIKVKNHGPAFYAIIAQYLPDYKSRQKSLRAIQKTIPRP